MAIQHVTAKFGKMRKAVEWVVYPVGEGGDSRKLRLQSDHRCIIIGVDSKIGLLSRHVANYPRFEHCAQKGTEVVKVPQEIVNAALTARPKPGQEIGGGVYIG